MAAVWTYLQANWMQLLVGLMAVDTILLGIFPTSPLLGSIKGILQSVIGTAPPPAAK